MVRQSGANVACFLAATDYVDTFDNAPKRHSTVKYWFDDGEPVREEWILSDHSSALQYPGDPLAFVRKIRQARRLQVESSRKAGADSETFNVSLFPDGLISGLEKTH